MTLKNKNYRIYGRTRGRNKKKFNEKYYQTLVNKYKVITLDKNENYILDIGCGYGETSIFLSNKFRDYKVISCDKYIDGNLKLLKSIESNKIKNFFFHEGNVNELLDTYERKEYFKYVWIFFPDPWPKKKHHKRRLVDNNFLKKIYYFIKNQGQIYITTDSKSYIRQIVQSIHKNLDLYFWCNQTKMHLSIKDFYDIETKFYKKAIFYGRKPSLFILKKI